MIFIYVYHLFLSISMDHGFMASIAMLTKTGGYIVWISQKISTRYPMMPWFSSAVTVPILKGDADRMVGGLLRTYWQLAWDVTCRVWRIYIYTLWRHAFQVDIWAGKKHIKFRYMYKSMDNLLSRYIYKYMVSIWLVTLNTFQIFPAFKHICSPFD